MYNSENRCERTVLRQLLHEEMKMSVKTLRQNNLRQSQNKIYDAVIRAQVIPGSEYSSASINVDSAERAPYKESRLAGGLYKSNNIINITIPEYKALETPSSDLKTMYLDAYKYAASMGYKSVVTEVIYANEAGAPFKSIFNTAMRAASAADNVEKCKLNIFIAVDNDIQEQVKKTLPKDILVRKPDYSLDRFNNSRSALHDSFMVMETLFQRVDNNGFKIEVEVPDELERALKSADYQDYYPEDETATGVLFECLGNHEMSKSAIQMELIEYLGKSTVYNALNPNYTKKALDKKTIVYVALAMGMDLLETKRALNAAHHKFIPKDPIDMVYAYAINHHLSVDDMRDILFVKNLLEYEN